MSNEDCSSCDNTAQSIFNRVCPDGNIVDKSTRFRKKVKILSTLDILISVFIVTPLVVACWRGTWELMDMFPEYFPPLESFIGGTIVYILIGIFQESLHSLVNKKHASWKHNVSAFIFMKLYTIILNIVTNMHWRGGWILVDQYFGISYTDDGIEINDVDGLVCFFTISFLIMFAIRSLRNLNSPPFEISLDYGNDMFLFPNMFRVKVSETLPLYVLDVFFSIAVVTNLGIVVWQGMWLAVDVYVYPEDKELSAWFTMILGYMIVAIVFLLQKLMKKLCDKISGVPRLLLADIYMIFSVIGVVLVWRGIWDLLCIYFLPEDQFLSCMICHWAPMVILMVMGCSNTLLVRGVSIDCEEPDGNCVVFPCNYLKVIFDQEKDDTWFLIWSGARHREEPTTAINYHVVDVEKISKTEVEKPSSLEQL